MSSASKDACLDHLQERLGWRFSDVELLRCALIHRSAASSVGHNNERLEFLGDRVLGLLAAERFYQASDELNEGDLTLRLNAFVRRGNCVRIAQSWGLWEHIQVGRSEKNASGRAREGILADACEAVLGAIFLDGGLEAARLVLEEQFRSNLAASDTHLRDPKTELQEWLHKRGSSEPVYRELARRGSVHAPVFTIEVDAGPAGVSRAEGTSKRRAEQQAAENILRVIETKRAAE